MIPANHISPKPARRRLTRETKGPGERNRRVSFPWAPAPTHQPHPHCPPPTAEASAYNYSRCSGRAPSSPNPSACIFPVLYRKAPVTRCASKVRICFAFSLPILVTRNPGTRPTRLGGGPATSPQRKAELPGARLPRRQRNFDLRRVHALMAHSIYRPDHVIVGLTRGYVAIRKRCLVECLSKWRLIVIAARPGCPVHGVRHSAGRAGRPVQEDGVEAPGHGTSAPHTRGDLPGKQLKREGRAAQGVARSHPPIREVHGSIPIHIAGVLSPRHSRQNQKHERNPAAMRNTTHRESPVCLRFQPNHPPEASPVSQSGPNNAQSCGIAVTSISPAFRDPR